MEPRTYFLNERHELSPGEKGGGGRAAQYSGIEWEAKAKLIHNSLQGAMDTVKSSKDPLKGDRYFLVANPTEEVVKRSTNKKKAPGGTYTDETHFGGAQGNIFDRLGIDLLEVADDGRAVVHADSAKAAQLVERSAQLHELGAREQSRWVRIDSFEAVPVEFRVDTDWLSGLGKKEKTDLVIELQPVLTSLDADRVLRAIVDLLSHQDSGKLTGIGSDFSGRHWFRGKATPAFIRVIARDFFSVQAVHSPLFSIAAAAPRMPRRDPTTTLTQPLPPVNPAALPCVAVVDLGVPADHRRLAAYRRGQFVPPEAPKPPVGDHGSFVASRVVFGNCQSPDDLSAAVGSCSFFDAMVGDFPGSTGNPDRIDDKIVMSAISGVRSAAPDVRVFNLSFGDPQPLAELGEVQKRQKRLLLQDLDNFVFANDVIVAVAAGNSARGLQPKARYPEHYSDPKWALGVWACGFNSLVCGAFVGSLSVNGLAPVGWPSPFSRIGPGLCDAPIPSFGAEGGNTDETFNWRPGLGVWGLSGEARPEDRSGTSHAAPLLAREAATALQQLERYCQPGAHPFGVTARAFLALTARRTVEDSRVNDLSSRTLGFGEATASRILSPVHGSAVVLWQGTIESACDTVRVQLPIPLNWLKNAVKPSLRLCLCYDPPVNANAQETWACRKVNAVLHCGPETDAPLLRSPPGNHRSYPLACREYDLSRRAPGSENAAEGDLWLLEISYSEIAPYPPAMDFDPRQRVAFAAELLDRSENPVDPQPAMQALPIAATMNRLSVQPVAIRRPVILKARI